MHNVTIIGGGIAGLVFTGKRDLMSNSSVNGTICTIFPSRFGFLLERSDLKRLPYP